MVREPEAPVVWLLPAAAHLAAMTEAPMPDANIQSYWIRTKKLMLVMMGLWVLVSVVIPLLVSPLNQFTLPYLELPLGFFMSSHGALIAFTLMLLWFARRQDRIDRDHFVGRGS
jgi:putative solute:sodium symporter small subunit